jgi:hypothetical protein
MSMRWNNGERKLFSFIVNMAIKAALTWITDRRTFVTIMNADAAQQCVCVRSVLLFSSIRYGNEQDIPETF